VGLNRPESGFWVIVSVTGKGFLLSVASNGNLMLQVVNNFRDNASKIRGRAFEVVKVSLGERMTVF
jgi:hypothetical protein